MLLLRTLVLLLAACTLISAGAWIITGDRRYMGYAWLFLRILFGSAAVFFGILILERIA